ncbi:MAG: trypsin-like peptidase domain-containing protein [Burkholderiaceae bacterium]
MATTNRRPSRSPDCLTDATRTRHKRTRHKDSDETLYSVTTAHPSVCNVQGFGVVAAVDSHRTGTRRRADAGRSADAAKAGFRRGPDQGRVGAAKGGFVISAPEIERLKQAGFTDDFVAYLRTLAPEKRVDNASVAAMLKQGRPVIEVLQEIASSKREFDGSVGALLAMNREVTLPASIARAISGRPLSVENLKELAGAGISDGELDLLLGIVGMAKVPLSPVDALALTQAGIGTDVVARAREAAAARPEPAREPERAFDPKTLTAFDHIAGLYRLHYPKEWFFERTLVNGSPYVFASPVRGITDPAKAATAIALSVEGRDTDTTTTPEQLLSFFNVAARQSLAGYEPGKSVSKFDLGVFQEFDATVDGVPIKGRVYSVLGRKHVYYLSVHAPQDDFARLLPMFEVVAQGLAVDSGASAKTRSIASSQDLVREFEEAIVQVRATNDGQKGNYSGTGFFIRADGYLVTNSHVVTHPKTGKPHDKFEVRWPERMNRDPEPAELVAFEDMKAGKIAGLSVGNDMAVLRINSTKPLKVIPLVQTEDVALGDQIVVIGYPLTELFGAKLETTVTSGVVTRFQRDEDDRVATIISDVTASGGNSGGPAISLRGGGAIGLLTGGTRWHLNESTKDAAKYSALVPVSVLRRFFPEETLVKAERSASMDYLDAYELALRAFQLGSIEGAMKVARRAIQRRPQDPNGYGLLAQIQLSHAEDKDSQREAVESLKRALDIDRKHVPSLLAQSLIELRRNDAIAALRYVDRAIEAEPKEWANYYQRATINIELARFTEALSDLKKAQEVSGELIPRPFSLAGHAHYENKNYEDGKAAYEKAVSLAPKDIEARLGIGQYYIHKKQLSNALIEFDRLNSDVPKVPLVKAYMGYTYFLQENFGKANEHLWDSFLGFQKAGRRTGEPPPAFLFSALAEAARKDRDPRRAIIAYTRLLQIHGKKLSGKEIIEAHEYLAEQARDDHPQIARLHLAAASVVAREESAEIRKRVREPLEKIAPGAVSLKDVAFMDPDNAYDLSLVREFILDKDTKLGFQIPGKIEADGDADEPLREWIVATRRAHGFSNATLGSLITKANRQAAAEPTRPEAQRGEGDPGPLSLIGRWRGPVQNGQAYVFEFQAGGQGAGNPFRLHQEANGAMTQLDQGTWAVAKEADGSQSLALDSAGRARQVRLPIAVQRNGADGPTLLINLNGQQQPFKKAG